MSKARQSEANRWALQAPDESDPTDIVGEDRIMRLLHQIDQSAAPSTDDHIINPSLGYEPPHVVPPGAKPLAHTIFSGKPTLLGSRRYHITTQSIHVEEGIFHGMDARPKENQTFLLHWTSLTVSLTFSLIPSLSLEAQHHVELSEVRELRFSSFLGAFGSVEVFTVDPTTPTLILTGLPDPRQVFYALQDALRTAKSSVTPLALFGPAPTPGQARRPVLHDSDEDTEVF